MKKRSVPTDLFLTKLDERKKGEYIYNSRRRNKKNNLHYYQQMPRSNDQDKNILQGPFQAR